MALCRRCNTRPGGVISGQCRPCYKLSWQQGGHAQFKVGPGAGVHIPDLPEPPGEWIVDGLCGQVDPELWYPEKGSRPNDAKRICQSCPVIEECLRYALGTPPSHDWGIWGGTTERERIKMRRQQETEAA